MMKITQREWNTHQYKHVSNGQKYIIHQGCLEPVEIDNENGLEIGKYLFEEHGLTFWCLAYTEDDALEIIKHSTWGHNLNSIKNLRREPVRK